MNEVYSLKVGGAGGNQAHQVNAFISANIADIAVRVYFSSPVEGELL